MKDGEFLRYSIVVKDKDGKVLKRLSARSKSYVKAWSQLFNVGARNAAQNIKDTAGADRSVGVDSDNWTATAGAGETNYGIRIGKGSTAVAIDDYALETPLAHGVGADEFSHQAQTFTAPAIAASTCSFTTTRIMINNTGSTIVGVRELGCYVRMANSYYGLAFRDVLGAGVEVPDGGSVTVEYTIGVTV